MMNLRANQEIPCSIRESSQPSKDQRGVCSPRFTFFLLHVFVSVSFLPTEAFTRCMIYSLLFSSPLLLERLVERTENFEPEYKAMCIWVTHFSHFCVCVWGGGDGGSLSLV